MFIHAHSHHTTNHNWRNTRSHQEICEARLFFNSYQRQRWASLSVRVIMKTTYTRLNWSSRLYKHTGQNCIMKTLEQTMASQNAWTLRIINQESNQGMIMQAHVRSRSLLKVHIWPSSYMTRLLRYFMQTLLLFNPLSNLPLFFEGLFQWFLPFLSLCNRP